MIQHNLLLIYRNFKRFRSSFFINLIGLSTGLACTLLIYLWVNDELLVDKFHAKDARIFKLMEYQRNSGSNTRTTDSTPGLLAETLASDMPEVEFSTVATPSAWFDKSVLSVGEKKIEAQGIYAGKDYFNIFSFGLLQGAADKVLLDKNSIVISEEIALSLFNTTENVIGKAIEYQREKQFLVSGIFKGTPVNSTQQFDFVLSFELFKELNPGVLNWGNSGPMTFVCLKEGSDLNLFNKKIEGLIGTKITEKHRTLFAAKYSDIYLHDQIQNGIQSGGRIEYVIMFSLIALFILAVACINFMNLSTAKATRRIKEVGIKKAVGANRRSLILQYMGESFMMSFMSLLIAVLLVDLLLPQFNQITGKQLSLSFDGGIILSFLSITFVTGFIAGSYPALYLSGFNPATVLKGKFNTSLGELWARKGLVVFQFAVSVIFIVSVLVIYKQIEYLQTKNLGYNKDNIIYFQIEGRIAQSREAFLTELKKLSGVVNASSVAQSMVGGGNTTTVNWEGTDPEDRTPFAFRPVNYDALEMLDIEIVDGKSFTRGGQDSLKIVFNEAAIAAMGMKDPVGKKINLGPEFELEIIGVAKDFHFESLRSNVNPMFFILAPDRTEKVMVRIAAGKEEETIELIRDFYNQFNPGFTFDFRFLDQDYQAQYFAERRVAKLSKYFAGLAILISCLGLFGLASFTAERRLKEIGIRKVLGASEFGIIYLLSADFTKIVFAAIVIALPISYLLTKDWLSDFAYRISLTSWYFIAAGAIALIIAWITVGMQALKASRVNPVECLRNE
jgi:putative ABC transport system permease protein